MREGAQHDTNAPVVEFSTCPVAPATAFAYTAVASPQPTAAVYMPVREK